MYTLKNTTIEKVQNSPQMKLTAVLSDGSDDVTIQTTVSTISEVKSTIKSNLQRLNDREQIIQAIADGTFTIEDEPAPEPTDVEKKKALFEAELAEYKDLVALSETLDGLVDQNDLTNKGNAVKNARTEYENARRNA